MKLMRGYRFRREALRMLKVFLLVWIASFLAVAVLEWGAKPVLLMVALVLSALVFLVIVAGLLAIDAFIQAHEKRHGGIQRPYPRAAGGAGK